MRSRVHNILIRRDLLGQLRFQPTRTDQPDPFAPTDDGEIVTEVPRDYRRGSLWAEPRLLAQITYSNWTRTK
jgi:hypothetical protein